MCLASKITGDEDGADHITISGNSALTDTDNYTINIITDYKHRSFQSSKAF